MQEKRCSFSVVVLDENIYAIGGHCGVDYVGSVERYSPTANSWGYVGRNIYSSKCAFKILKRKLTVQENHDLAQKCFTLNLGDSPKGPFNGGHLDMSQYENPMYKSILENILAFKVFSFQIKYF